VNRDKNRKTLVHLRLTPGVYSGTLKQYYYAPIPDTDYGKANGYRLGAELEFALPINKYKWSVLLEPAYQSVDFKKDRYKATYQSIETILGVRYAFFLGQRAKLFVNAGVLFDKPLKYEGTYFSATLPFNWSVNAGVGFSYGRFSVEGRGYGTRSVLVDGEEAEVRFQKISAILGFRIF